MLLHSLCSSRVDPFIRASHLMELITLLDCDDKNVQAAPDTSRMSAILEYIDAHLVEITCIKDVAEAFLWRNLPFTECFMPSSGSRSINTLKPKDSPFQNDIFVLTAQLPTRAFSQASLIAQDLSPNLRTSSAPHL